MADREAYESGDPEYRRYVAEIDLYEREFKPWESRGKKITKLFKDADNQRGNRKRFNVLWSNVETLKPALYARDPQPVAERRFKDADPVGRVASEVLERCLAYTIDCQHYGEVAKQAVSDRLLPGRGVAWHRYEAEVEDDEESYSESVIPDYVYWEDFGHNIARTWAEVTLVWRKVYMTRSKLVKRFGEKGQTIPLDHTPKGLKDEKVGEDVKKACIYELWDKEKGKVCFLSKSHPEIIEADDDPLHLTGMFPCQRPLYATITTDSLVPTPDYALYQTQAVELEELTARIDALQKALKLSGVYDASAPELANLLSGGYENKLIGVQDWSKFSEKGGLDGSVDFVPLKDVADTLIALYEAREKAKQDLYEITGIADIIRGNTEPNETATAQQIKGRFAVLRISDSQADVQRWVRDGMRIMGEIIAEHFSLETIQAISGIKLLTQAEKEMIGMQMKQYQAVAQMAQQQGQQPPPPPVPPEQIELMREPAWEEVHELLRHQVLREFRVDIETDSTIRTDEDADRQERTEFLNVAGNYIDKAVTASQMVPELAPLLTEMLMFGVRAHRSARNLEPVFEDAMKRIQQPKPPRPDPEMAKVEAQKEIAQQKAQTDMAIAQQKAQLDAQTEQAKQASQHEEELARQQLEDQRAQRELERTTQLETYKAELEMQLMREKAQLEAQTKIQVAQIQGEQKQKEMEFQERTRAEDKANGEAKKAHDGERQKSRDATLQQAQKVIEALSALRQQVH